MVGGLGVWGMGSGETEKGTTVLCSVKNQFPRFTNKKGCCPHSPAAF